MLEQKISRVMNELYQPPSCLLLLMFAAKLSSLCFVFLVCSLEHLRCEGLMIKVLGPRAESAGTFQKAEPVSPIKRRTGKDGPHSDYALSTYQPSKRCENWLKV
eukprot:m.188364 g.188364  ORF g.188364 m.188364 type:complete len:104 (+) comp16723_c0_seq4:37-348(+)